MQFSAILNVRQQSARHADGHGFLETSGGVGRTRFAKTTLEDVAFPQVNK
jgi:hypothetical protein